MTVEFQTLVKNKFIGERIEFWEEKFFIRYMLFVIRKN